MGEEDRGKNSTDLRIARNDKIEIELIKIIVPITCRVFDRDSRIVLFNSRRN